MSRANIRLEFEFEFDEDLNGNEGLPKIDLMEFIEAGLCYCLSGHSEIVEGTLEGQATLVSPKGVK